MPETVLFRNTPGNTAAKEYVRDLVTSGRMPHAVIIESAGAVDPRTFAYEIAAALNCRGASSLFFPCGTCTSCRKIMEGKCVDVREFGKESDKATITVDITEKICEDAVMTPSECDSKVYIIDRAELLNTAAQNKLLKIIEEPPVDNTYFIFSCMSSDALLPTVRSRSVTLTLRDPDYSGEIDAVMKSAGCGRDVAVMAVKAANGDKKTAVSLASGKDVGNILRCRHAADELLYSFLTSKTDAESDVNAFRIFDTLCDGLKDENSRRNALLSLLRHEISACRDIAAFKRAGITRFAFFLNADIEKYRDIRTPLKTLEAIADVSAAAASDLKSFASARTVFGDYACTARRSVSHPEKPL